MSPLDNNPYAPPQTFSRGRVPRKLLLRRAKLFSALAIVGLLIGGLYGLAHLPYRPPHDMSTLLGATEIRTVWTLIGLLAIVWLAIFVWFVSTLVHTKK
jgi:hypothetical protein